MMTSACCARFTKRRHVYLLLHFISFALLYAPNQIGWYFGNLAVYLNSYWYATKNPTSFESQWVLSVFIISWGITLFIAGKLVSKIGRRITMFIGVIFFDAGMFGSYFSVQYSQVAFIITFGCLNGIGLGFIQTEIYARIPSLISQRLGLAFALLNNFFILGSALYQGILTWHTNPWNEEADQLVFGHFKVFSQKSVVDHVPSVFLLLGIVTSSLHWTGLLLSAFLMDKGTEKPEKDSDQYAKPTESTSFKQHIKHMKDNLDTQMVKENNSKLLSVGKKTSESMCSDYNGSNCYFQTIEEHSKSHEYHKSFTSDSSSIEKTNIADNDDLNEIQMLKTVAFYVLWFTYVANEGSYVILLNFYKTFGELYIHDDHFLTFMGMAFLCVVFVMRIVWAMLIDWYGIKSTQIVLNTFMSLSFLFYFFTPQVNRWLFALWTSAITGLCSAVYLNFPVMTLKLFGKTHFTSNYPIVATSTIVLNIIAPPASQVLINDFGWASVFITTGAVNLVALVAVVMGLPNKK